MSTVTIPYRFVVKRDTAANFVAANTLLLNGEFGLETDTLWPIGGGRKFKLGDGVTAWNSLAYAVPDSGGATAWPAVMARISLRC